MRLTGQNESRTPAGLKAEKVLRLDGSQITHPSQRAVVERIAWSWALSMGGPNAFECTDGRAVAWVIAEVGLRSLDWGSE